MLFEQCIISLFQPLVDQTMELTLPLEVAQNYRSSSQRIRVMTEAWVGQSAYCPNCGNPLSRFDNNQPVADFFCGQCSEQYELKSKKGAIGNRLLDGAFTTMIERLVSEKNPHFFFLTYEKDSYKIGSFFTIPKYFFVPGIIEERNPLADTARRAGWIGCNIVMSSIPEFGKIFYVQNGVMKSKEDVLERWRNTEFLKSSHDLESRGWLLDVLNCVEKLKKQDFTLNEIYGYADELSLKHPQNRNVQAKIRQQLQFLRDKGFIEFLGRGRYQTRSFHQQPGN